jgi:transcriptional regulator of acetoin/glycerol metabolism
MRQTTVNNLPDTILRSWHRCTDLGVIEDQIPYAEPLSESELKILREASGDLLPIVEPELDFLGEMFQGTDSVVVLANANGMILDARGVGSFLDKAGQIALKSGVVWNESERGTNAIGTAIAEGGLVEVWGSEHFHRQHAVLCCTAAPILDHQGRIAGVIDISGDARLPRGYAQGALSRAIREVEHRWLMQSPGQLQRLRFHEKGNHLGSFREGVLLLDDEIIVGANREAVRWLNTSWSLIGERWSNIFKTPPLKPGSEESLLVTQSGMMYRGILEKPTPITRDKPAPNTRSVNDSSEPVVVPHTSLSSVSSAWLDSTTRHQLNQAVRAVDAELSVIIQGETGTGKEVMARLIHEQCLRAHKPFVAINCAALPEGLIESELFGYAEGAFTGARKSGSIGRVFEADGGILFLDEIGDMSLMLQTRLLRVLQDRAVQPLGGGKSRPVNFVVLSATHRDLAAMVSAGTFRADLYYRLHFHQIDLAPLRHRADKAAFIEALWQEAGATRRQLILTEAARQTLINFDWPGNFRQLAHLVKTLVALAEPGQHIDIDNLPAEYRMTNLPVSPGSDNTTNESVSINDEELSPERIRLALEQSHYKVATAARRLGVHRSTLYRYMAAFNL